MAAAMNPDAPLAAVDEISKLRRGDPDALAAAITRYQHRLYRYLLRFVEDPTAAEDLFQTWMASGGQRRLFEGICDVMTSFLSQTESTPNSSGIRSVEAPSPSRSGKPL